MEGPFKRKKKEEPMNMIGKNRRRGRLEDKTENSGKKRTEEEARIYAESHFLQEDQESNNGKNDQLTKEDILKIRQILEAEEKEKKQQELQEQDEDFVDTEQKPEKRKRILWKRHKGNGNEEEVIEEEISKSVEKDPRDQAGINRQILKVAYLFAGLFLVLMGYIGYFVGADSKNIITNSRNERQELFAKSVIRGNIETSDGEVLAKTEVAEDGTEKRVYPQGRQYAHVVGYTIKGKYGLESAQNYNLLTSNANFFERLYHTLRNEKSQGDTVVTTLNSRLQKAAYDAIGDRKGAAIVMEPSTGKILAMVSKPDFDPNTLSDDWAYINSEAEQENSRLLNRATQGLYPPGSTYKIITALEYMRENTNYKDYHYNCEGESVFHSVSIECYNKHRHGEQDFYQSFANSCNTSFANIGTSLNKKKWADLCEELLFNQALPVSFPHSKSSFVLNGKSDDKEVPQTSIGQGKTLMSPLHNVMITSAIANGGVLMKPYLVDQIENYTGGSVHKFTGKAYGTLMTAGEAEELTAMMKQVVEEGTASYLSGRSYTVAGKTGSAEFKEGEPAHAWFTGFAPADNPEIAVCVIIENVGAGSTYAVPAASKIFDAYFSGK